MVKMGRASFVFHQRVERGAELLVEADVTLALVDAPADERCACPTNSRLCEMTLTQDLDIWTLILHASIVVKVVMGLLVAVSFMSWMFIFQKWFAIGAPLQTDKFEREFWSGND